MTEEAGGGAGRRTVRKATRQSLENAALHYLERFAASTESLRRVLMRRVERSARAHGTDRDEGAEAVAAILARFQGAGLLDDATYAEGRVASLHRRGVSARGIRRQLAAKGVDRETVEDVLAQLAADTPDPDLAAAIAYARRRRLGPWRGTDRADRRDRDLAALARQGFSYQIALRVIDAPDPDTLETD
ncbi:MAG: regulatory protein RecX [Alphaproteobacteria bacterium]